MKTMKISIKREQNDASISSAEREKFGTKFKTLKLFSMAALALLMAACSNDDNDVPQQEGKIPFSATIAAPSSGATTRTIYNETSDGYINVAWKSGDQIALVHGGVKDVVTVGTPNPDGSAPISGTITVGADNEDIVLVYPADLVASATGGTAYTENATVTNKFKTQAGTLAYIQDNLDIRKGTGKLAVSGASASLKANVSMASQIAIWKLTMTHYNPIDPKKVIVKVGGNSVAEASISVYYATTVVVYLALDPATMGSGALRIEAYENYPATSWGYYYEKAGGVSLTAGKYYQSSFEMGYL